MSTDTEIWEDSIKDKSLADKFKTKPSGGSYVAPTTSYASSNKKSEDNFEIYKLKKEVSDLKTELRLLQQEVRKITQQLKQHRLR